MASNNLGGKNKTVTQNYFLTNENMESIFTRFMCRSSLLVFIIGEPVVDCVDLKIVNLKIDRAKIESSVYKPKHGRTFCWKIVMTLLRLISYTTDTDLLKTISTEL